MVVEEDEAESKEAEDEGVFFGFGNQSRGRAGHYQTQSARTRRAYGATRRKIRAEAVMILADRVDSKVGDGLRQGALPAP